MSYCWLVKLGEQYKLVDEYSGLRSDFVPLYKTANLPKNDKRSITSLISLYRIVKIISTPPNQRALSRYIKGPADQSTVTEFYNRSVEFWDAVKTNYKQVEEVFSSKPDDEMASKFRHSNGGHLLFRPYCLVAFAKATQVLINRKYSIRNAVKAFKNIQMELNADPWIHVVWNPSKKTMINKNELLIKNLLLDQAKQELSPNNYNLKDEYKKAIGK